MEFRNVLSKGYFKVFWGKVISKKSIEIIMEIKRL